MSHLILFILDGCSKFWMALPRSTQIKLGHFLGWCIGALGYRKSVVQQNLSFAFPHRSDLFWKSYESFGNLLLEMLLLFGKANPLEKFVKKWVQLKGLEHVHQAQKEKKPIFFLSSHLGNWEIMAAAGSLLGHIDLLLLSKQIKPSWLHEACEKARLACGVKSACEPRTMEATLQHLRSGGVVGAILDQYTGPPVSVRVPFWGRPVGTSLALSMLVKRTGACVLPVTNFRTPEGGWVVEISPPLPWLEGSTIQEEFSKNTAQYTQILETHIEAHPEQWLWVHRRFKGPLGPLEPDEWKTRKKSSGPS